MEKTRIRILWALGVVLAIPEAAAQLTQSQRERLRQSFCPAPVKDSCPTDAILIQRATAQIKSQCQGLIGRVANHEGKTPAATAELGKVFFHADKCVKRADYYTGSFSWLEALTNRDLAAAKWRELEGAGLLKKRERIGGQIDADKFDPSGSPEERLRKLERFCRLQRGKLDLVRKQDVYRRLSPGQKAAADGAIAIATKALDRCDNVVAKKWYSALGVADEASMEVAKALGVIFGKLDQEHEENCVAKAKALFEAFRKSTVLYQEAFDKQQDVLMHFLKCATVDVQNRIKNIERAPVRPCIAKINAAAGERDCKKLVKIGKDVQECLKPAQTALKNNSQYFERLTRDPVVQKSCREVISRRAWVDVLDPVFAGGCASFFQWLRSNTCEALVGWLGDKITQSRDLPAVCGKGFAKGLVCGVVNSLAGISEMACGAVEKLLEGPCKYAAPVPVVGVPAAFACALGHYVGQQVSRAGRCMRALWSLRGASEVYRELKLAFVEVTCDFIGGIVFELVVSKGAGTPGKLQSALKAVERVLKAPSTAVDRALKIRDYVSGLVGQVNQNCGTALALGGGPERPIGRSTTSGATPRRTERPVPRPLVAPPHGRRRAPGQPDQPLAGRAGYVNVNDVSFRTHPSITTGSVMRYLKRCQAVQILGVGIRATPYEFTKVKVADRIGYIASKYVSRGACR